VDHVPLPDCPYLELRLKPCEGRDCVAESLLRHKPPVKGSNEHAESTNVKVQVNEVAQRLATADLKEFKL
jgi:hypothetical protein